MSQKHGIYQKFIDNAAPKEENDRTKFTLGAFACIFSDEPTVNSNPVNYKKKCLLCHRTDIDLWNLPGGGVETKEAPWEAVIRETKEETGLIVVIKHFVGCYAKPEQDDLVFLFICNIVGGRLSETAESNQNKFFAIDDLPDNLSPKHRERIIDAACYSGQVIQKKQYGPTTRKLIKLGLYKKDSL